MPQSYRHNLPPVREASSQQEMDGITDVREDHPYSRDQEKDNVNQPWSRRSSIVAYMCILIVVYVCSLQQQISASLLTHIMSSFGQHPFIAFSGMLQSIFGTVCTLPLAKVINNREYTMACIWAFAWTITGLVLTATSKSVSAFIVHQMSCWCGYYGIFYILDVMIADMSSLEHRALLLAFARAPYIMNAFVAPNIAQLIYQHNTWRWAYGSFAILLFLAFIALLIFLSSQGTRTARVKDRADETNIPTLSHNFKIFLLQFDVVGLFLLAMVIPALLIPFGGEKDRTISEKVVSVAVGGVFLLAFGIWETVHAPFQLVPLGLLLRSTVLGVCLAGLILFTNFYCLNTYFMSYLQVVYNFSIPEAGFIHNIYVTGACFTAILTGVLIRATGKFKLLAIIAMVWHFIATGLILHFRRPNNIPATLIVLFQALVSISGGVLGICGQIAIMAATPDSNVAAVLSLLSLFTGLGAAIGQVVASAIYTHSMPRALSKYLPADTRPWAKHIYGSITQQLSYPMTSPVRQAIIQSYSECMRYMCLAALCVLPISLLSVMMWKNIGVGNAKRAQVEAI
ncbi:major facilitator superfamily domain-containing protein [Talaromyces proteolyticus]|uniref:Major facilitator superfamily domain-containing protein n=1 Tax=Talaromyces proteolyticus TaxID=1131652 RepID=A0AAD4KZA8_9EURO|nr:major facilitator superfamily domain-containing protein [Talaromyces proteolyticus]KAH8703373.1 major facilitator superfamily domain-containing protein [Talaromyces proteolyticus]